MRSGLAASTAAATSASVGSTNSVTILLLPRLARSTRGRWRGRRCARLFREKTGHVIGTAVERGIERVDGLDVRILDRDDTWIGLAG